MNIFKIQSTSILLLFLFHSLAAQSELDTSKTQESHFQTLDEISLTANLFPLPLSQTGQVVQSISENTMKINSGKNAHELLNMQSGIQLTGTNSNYGAVKSLNLRGANNGQTLILIDGIPIYDPTGIGNALDLRLLSYNSFSKIEILKGSQSTYYGSDAVAGVVNFISPQTDSTKFKASGSIGGGNYGVLQSKITMNVPITKKIAAVFDFSNFNSDGISDAKDTTKASNFDKDKITQYGFFTKIDAHILPKLLFSPFFRLSSIQGDYDGGAFLDNTFNHYESIVFQTGYSLVYKKNKLELKNSFSYLESQKKYFDKSPYTPEENNGSTYWANLAGKYSATDWLDIVSALEYRGHTYNNIQFLVLDNAYNITGRNDSAFHFNQYSFSLNTHFHWNNTYFLELGGRGNFSPSYNANLTYNAILSYYFIPQIKVFASIANAFKVPSLYQLHSPYGNKNLKPEKSITYEMGLRGKIFSDKLGFSLVGFFLQSQDVIAYLSKGYTNYDKQNNQGIELDIEFSPIKNLVFTANYSYTQGEVTTLAPSESKDTTYANLYKIGSHKINLNGLYTIGEDFIHLGAGAMFVSSRQDLTFDPVLFNVVKVEQDPYIITNAYGDIRFFKHKGLKCIFFVDVKNVTNTDYQETYGFSTLGINFVAGIKVLFH